MINGPAIGGACSLSDAVTESPFGVFYHYHLILRMASEIVAPATLEQRGVPSEGTVTAAIADAVEGYRGVFGDRLAQVWLFGSRAVGTHQPNSDVDLLEVLHEEGPIGSELDLLYSVAEPIRLAHGVFIDGHPTTLECMEEEDDDFHYFIRREGKRVDAL